MSVIAAISTPIGAGGIGIVRTSGDGALKIADAIFNFKGGKNDWKPLTLHFGVFHADGFDDVGYAVYFPAAKAYTGEDTVEFYLHGGVRIMKGALEALLSQGARLAQKGEFTKKAFLAGRLSLADAEGVIDMINAESAAGLRAAYRLMDGSLTRNVNGLADRLGLLISGLEAALDYPEEMEDEVLPSLPDSVRRISGDIEALLRTAGQGKLVKHGVTAVLWGAANAGKSSLLNAMLGEDRAIVTDIAGTTRDTVECSLEHCGVRINLVDTAGVRHSDDVIESEGVERAQRAAKGADVVLNVIDRGMQEGPEPPLMQLTFDVYSKCDVYGFAIPKKAHSYAVSAKTGEGVQNLLDNIAALAGEGAASGDVITNERHISALNRANSALKDAILAIDGPIDCILTDLRSAYDALGEISGRTATEDIVDLVFERFCVGK